jgi:DNA-binding transcriptional LysR family regulator
MKNFDHLSMDGHLLRLLVALVEQSSVTQVAHQFGVGQSAVSHQLERLRAIAGDALFVKKGRGIEPTQRAREMAAQAQEVLRQLQRMGYSQTFDPGHWQAVLRIAANDFQRDLLLPALAAALRDQAPHVRLRVLPSAVPRVELLRNDTCQLVLSPRPPQATDVYQKRLFTDRYALFYDAASCPAPKSRKDFLAARHASVVYPDGSGLDVDEHLAARGLARDLWITVPAFNGLPSQLRGTDLVALAPSLLSRSCMAGLSMAPPPVSCPPVPMYAIWHARYQQDPAHQWLRAQVEAATRLALADNVNP